MPAFSLDVADATELAELLRFLNDWLVSDRDQLDASLRRFVGHPAYDIRALRADLDRFAFLLGDDGPSRVYAPTPKGQPADHTHIQTGVYQTRGASRPVKDEARHD